MTFRVYFMVRIGLELSPIIFILAPFLCIDQCESHGRLIEPPSRASAWRYGFQTRPDYNDHELYCGGFTRQWKHNDGKCGECGDAWDMPEPRPHENGGQWGQGVIVRSYLPGSEITIRVELTASHMGYFEFRLCPEPNAKQLCLDRNVLHILSGSPSQPNPTDIENRFYPRNGSRIYDIKTRLPDISCNQCMLQWRYVAGNNWGTCDDGNEAVGCGPQEEFRSCSDIALTNNARTSIWPFRPTSRMTARPTTQSKITEKTNGDNTFDTLNKLPIWAFGITLLLVACLVANFYYYGYNQKFREWIKPFANRFSKSLITSLTCNIFSSIRAMENSDQKGNLPDASLSMDPIPPPRLKRPTRVKEISADTTSIA